MDTNHVILQCLKAIASGEGAEKKIAVLEAIVAENRHASESEAEILMDVSAKPKKKKA